MNDTKTKATAGQELQQLYTKLARAFTENHEFLFVEVNSMPGFVSLSPRAHRNDVGKLIGDNGATFTAMRNLCACAAHRLGVRFHLSKIKDDHRTEKNKKRSNPILCADWPRAEILALAQETCDAVFNGLTSCEWAHQDACHSVLEIRCSFATEMPPIPMPVVAENFDTVFKAVGNARGHAIKVEFLD